MLELFVCSTNDVPKMITGWQLCLRWRADCWV